MPDSLRIAYFAHTVRSDWNNGNAHFLRGLLRALGRCGHQVTAFEPDPAWSLQNLLEEEGGPASIEQFNAVYPDLKVCSYPAESSDFRALLQQGPPFDIVILHEWNPPALAQTLLTLRAEFGFKLLFHDTHHRASSSPASFANLGLQRFDGILAFGESLRAIYRDRFRLNRVWILHEAADVSVFKPQKQLRLERDVVWIGNWGEGERAEEIREYLIKPASSIDDEMLFTVYGVRYPPQGLEALRSAKIDYSGYLPNLEAPLVYGTSRMTVHIPRQQYTSAMLGIPTIRIFEALACGIPLISAPWQDTEHLFRDGDYLAVTSAAEMAEGMREILGNPEAAQAQAAQGLATILARHTCDHRAHELTAICQELLA